MSDGVPWLFCKPLSMGGSMPSSVPKSWQLFWTSLMRRNYFFFPLESVYVIRERNFTVGSFGSQSSYSPINEILFFIHTVGPLVLTWSECRIGVCGARLCNWIWRCWELVEHLSLCGIASLAIKTMCIYLQ